MQYLKSIPFLVFLFFLTGCERAFIDENPENTPLGNFESLYETVRDKYSFFELKGINWDSVRTHYRPQIKSDMSNQALFDVLDSMLYDLRDGHVNLVSRFDLNRNWNWYLPFSVNFNYDVIERNYLKEGYQFAGGLRYTIIDSIGYVYYGSFSSSLSNEGLNKMLADFKDTKGLIMDVRDNGGGFLNNALFLSSALVQEEKKGVLVTFEKTGSAPNDFGNGLSYTIKPRADGNYKGRVVLLTNRKCYSATNFFAAIMSNFSNVTIIGDQTGGGGGIPIDFQLPNGWRYRFSGTTSLLSNGYNIELGIPPNISVTNNPAVNASGIDEILERGLQELR